MLDAFSIGRNWLTDGSIDSGERVTFAELRLCVGESHVLTTLYDALAQTERDVLRVSALPLARWLAANWWRLTSEPHVSGSTEWTLRHNLLGVGDGFTWPDISMHSNGMEIMIRARRTHRTPGVPIEYRSFGSYVVGIEQFEEEVSSFIEGVRHRLFEFNISDPDLEEFWSSVQGERADADLSRQRHIEALAGFDPEAAPDSLCTKVDEAVCGYGEAGVLDLVAWERERIQDALQKLTEIGASDSPVSLDPSELSRLRDQIVYASGGTADDILTEAAAAARRLRAAINLKDHPVTNKVLGDLLGVSMQDVFSAETTKRDTVLGSLGIGVARDDSSRLNILFPTRHQTSRRFQVARHVADLIWVEQPRLSVATRSADDRQTFRQKRQRAFAQEFLCPLDVMKSRLPVDDLTSEDVEEFAAEFEVSPYVVQTKLANEGLISREWLPGSR